ncbi:MULTISPECIES: LacI family DNA-binding transcriptional regulator [Arthrobacter]|uniref:LacI family DNA-binding transcriptional regulator n=1 Tax=Arthrobacter terricola TaxID=2547396 RepID=A0A4R5KNT7_9MICC|nr:MULTISPECIES: LacI family DNA-binding transcriptional regulator [Arthrobacter]MBT8160899.1 LacI family DNA-binding transcriptional regulator [Arthrobacter sp. GN70]TDF97349.1 LacI family DNA-binding transcriptional regulator [Arthrobacter terricola]
MSKVQGQGRRPTMRDVARAAGVSPAAVSQVLNERPEARIGKEARARILAAVEELGFRPDMTGRQLRLQRTQTLGLITDEIATSPFAGQIVRAAHDVAWASGRLVFLVNTMGDSDVEGRSVRGLLDRRVDGLLYAATYVRGVDVPPETGEVPTVLVNCFPSAASRELPAVVPAERHGGGLAIRCLIDAGHRDVVYLAGAEHLWATRERVAAFIEHTQASGLSSSGSPVLYGPYTIDSGYDRAIAVLDAPRRPTALLCGNDRIALGALLAAQALGLAVPRDLSLVGYDDQEELADRIRPALTTVSLPHYRLGEIATRALLGLIEGQTPPGVQEVRGELIERASVASPPSRR